MPVWPAMTAGTQAPDDVIETTQPSASAAMTDVVPARNASSNGIDDRVELSRIRGRLGFRLSLSHLCETNLGQAKAGEGMQSLAWWKEGRIDLIERYCRRDVELTGRLYDLGRRQRFLLYRDHAQRRVRVPVEW